MQKPYIIFFTTAYKEHAAQAFALEAFDYILKPYDEKRIAAMLHKLEATFFSRDLNQTDKEKGVIFPKKGDSIKGLGTDVRVNLRKKR
ncbi:hypothetical protein GCM10020331_020420 [Ectobacillus funiculus]